MTQYNTVRRIAEQRGDTTYQTTRTCKSCGGHTRSTVTGDCMCVITSHIDRPLSAREEARAAGLTFYKGAPCKHGHTGKRYVSKSQCYDCQMLASANRPYGEEQRESRKLYRAAHRIRHDESLSASQLRREQRKRDTADGTITAATISALLTRQGGTCVYCLSPAEHLDHMTPLNRDGSHTLTNVQWLCGPCNQRKGEMTDAEYRAYRAIL